MIFYFPAYANFNGYVDSDEINDEDDNPFRYCGEYFDKETGTIYLRARYYNPAIGRFITEDSYLGESNDPLSLNLYTYCSSNPINFWDPTGHWQAGDANYSFSVQALLLEASIEYDFAQTPAERESAHQKAESIRATANSGLGWAYNGVKKITEASCDALSFMNSSSKWERDELVEIIRTYNPGFSITDGKSLSKAIFIGSLIMPSGAGKGAVKGARSLIKNNKTLIKAAKEAGADKLVQEEMNGLIFKFLRGNANPGKGSKYLFNGIYELRGETGARIYYRVTDGVLEILGKSNKDNQKQVIKILKKMYE